MQPRCDVTDHLEASCQPFSNRLLTQLHVSGIFTLTPRRFSSCDSHDQIFSEKQAQAEKKEQEDVVAVEEENKQNKKSIRFNASGAHVPEVGWQQSMAAEESIMTQSFDFDTGSISIGENEKKKGKRSTNRNVKSISFSMKLSLLF